MEFLGIGPLEIIVILLIIFVVMGPSDIVKMARTLGQTLRNLRRSEMWTAMQRAQKEIRTLPDTLARQADLENVGSIKKELEAELKEQGKEIQEIDREISAWTREGAKKQDTEVEKEAPPEAEKTKEKKAEETKAKD